jgi:alpha-mannosidase
VASARFGEEVASPLQAVVVKANPHGLLPAAPTSLLSVAEPNVFILGTKLPDQGTGLIVRLWEVAGQQTDAHLRLAPALGGKRAEACNLVEDPAGPLEIRDGVVTVPLRGRGLATVRIQ